MKNNIPLVALFISVIGCESPAPTPALSSAPVASTSASAATTGAPSAKATVKKPAHEPSQPLNVLLITIDSMRADMPWQGYDRDIAPTLSALVKQGVLYTDFYTVASYTAKSVGAMLTGRYPSSLYRGGTFFTHFSDANVFFTELLQKAQVRTMAGHAHLYFDRKKNLRQGFDHWRLTPGLKWNASTDESVTSEDMTKLAIEMLDDSENTSKQFFMWLHYMDPHDQYVQHSESPKWGRRNRDRYDSEMFYTDLQLRKLFDYCEKQKWWSKTAVLVSADHGEAFGEHDMYKHAFALWEVLTRVPLIVKAPGVKPARISARRSQIDLAPTIMELMGQPLSDGFVGKSMVPELYGAKPDDREPIVLDLPADTNNPETRAIIKGDYKLIVDAGGWGYKLYDLKKDPGERKNLVKHRRYKKKLDEMKALFESTWKDIPQVRPYGNNRLTNGKRANGPHGPPGWSKTKSAK